jgi:hypothetical protein
VVSTLVVGQLKQQAVTVLPMCTIVRRVVRQQLHSMVEVQGNVQLPSIAFGHTNSAPKPHVIRLLQPPVKRVLGN